LTNSVRAAVGPAALLSLTLVACGSASPTAPAAAQPIQAPKNTWTWVDFPDSSCGDGTHTGIGINPGDSPNLLVFLEGGGACYTYSTCFGSSTAPPAASAGPFGPLQFGFLSTTTVSGITFQHSVLDRSETVNPFRDWSLVYVPYCTGDVHGGDNVATYTDPQGTAHSFHHAGHANVQAFLKRLLATFPAPTRVAVAGTSAGGFGASVNYDTFRASWPAAKVYLVDDSGPPLEGPQPKAAVDTFDRSWGIYHTLDPFCPACRQDLSNIVPALAAKYPGDRLSLLSYERDNVIPTFFGLTTDEFLASLQQTEAVIGSVPGAKYFLVGGTTPTSPQGHTLIRNPGSFTVDGVVLWTFLGQQVSDDPGWTSRAAP
jgi:Pectinacetylesterase